eukprot:1206691-Amorphochlora_amoeboformis.AAC.1
MKSTNTTDAGLVNCDPKSGLQAPIGSHGSLERDTRRPSLHRGSCVHGYMVFSLPDEDVGQPPDKVAKPLL